MRLAFSNIAWDIAEDEAVAAVLSAHGVDAIDIAPGKYFPDIAGALPERMRDVRTGWQARGIEITGMQALLFGTSGLNLFGDTETQARMLSHLGHVCRIAEGVGATRLTFGSPKNRDMEGRTDEEAKTIATEFFARLGMIAAQHGVTFCLEPNPVRYHCNFMTDTAQAEAIVHAVAHPNIRLQLDTGAMAINAEPADETLARVADIVGHIHLSEPDLLPLGDPAPEGIGHAPHAILAPLLERHLPHCVATIEMVATGNEPHLSSIARALVRASSAYREKRV